MWQYVMDQCTHLNDILEGVNVVSFGLDEFAHDKQQCPERGSEKLTFILRRKIKIL